MLALPILLAAFSLRVSALNDWNVPCTDGKCSYDWVGDGSKKAFSSLAVDGSRQLLSDVTQAAGWKVMDCNPDWEDGPHDVRLICDGTPEQVANCDHVYQNGAENTVVRLPQSCGVGPFARVNKAWEPSNQTISDNVKRGLNSRAPRVRAMTLDYNFTAIPESKGKLNFMITSTNKANPVVNRRRSDLGRRGRDRYLYRRGLFDSIKDGLEDAGSAVTDAAKSAATAVTDGASAAASAVSSVATDAATVVTSAASDAATAVTDAGKAVATTAVKVADKAENATSFNKTETGKDVPIKFDKNFTVIDSDISCVNFKNDIEAHVHLDVDAHMDANINYGYTLVGSLVPFKLDDMAVFASLTGTANMTFGVSLEATGQMDTFPVEIFKIGLPGLSIPGVGALGPELKLEYRLTMDVDIAAQMDINTSFDFGNVNMVFPENKGNSTATSKPVKNDNTVQISTANTGTDFSGTIEALIIPSINFGVDLSVVSAAVFLDMEIGAEMEMIGTSGIGGPPAAVADDAEGEEAATDDVAAEDGTTADGAVDDTDATAADGAVDDTDATAADAAVDETDAAAVDASTEDPAAATEDPTAEEDSTAADGAAVARRAVAKDASAKAAAATSDEATDEVPEDTTDDTDVATTASDETADEVPEDDSAVATGEDAIAADDGTAVEDDTADTAAEDGTAEESVPEDDTVAAEDEAATDDGTVTEDEAATDDGTVTEDEAATEDGTVTEDEAATEDATATEDAPPEPQPLTGCVRVNGIMEMNYGLRGTVVPLFPQALRFPLLQTKKELFTKCFGGATPDILDSLSEEAAGLESTVGEVGAAADPAAEDAAATEDPAAAEDAAAAEDPAATAEDPAAADADVAAAPPARRKRHVPSIRQRRLASLQKRDFIDDLKNTVEAAAPALASAALNVLVCPSGFFPAGAFAALPI